MGEKVIMSAWISSWELTKTYGKENALDHVSIEIYNGVSLVYGPNGAGKSTFVSILEGIQSPTHGYAEIFGKKPATDPAGVMKDVAFLPERPQFFGSRIVGDFLYWSLEIGEGSESEARRLLGLFDIDYLLHRKFNSLSLGEMQLVNIVAVLSLKRRGYVLDEPNANLDPARRFRLAQEISALSHNGKNFLITTHIMDEILSSVEFTIAFNKGKLVHSFDNSQIKDSNAFSTYLSSNDQEALLKELVIFSPKVVNEYVVIDGISLGEILNHLSENVRLKLRSTFTYPRMVEYEP